LFWVLLVGSTLLYFPNETLRGTAGYLIIVGIIASVCWFYLMNPQDTRSIGRAVYNLSRSPHFLFYCLCLIGSQVTLALFYGEVEGAQLFRMAGYVSAGTISYIVLPVIMGTKRLRQFWMALMGVGAGSALLGLPSVFIDQTEFLGLPIYQCGSMDFLGGLYSTAGPFFEPNMYASVLALGVFGASYFILRREHLFLASFVACICLFMVIFAWSRGVYLGIALGFSIWLWIGANRRQRVWLALGGGLLTVIAVFFLFPLPLFDNLLQLGVGMYGRDVLWAAALEAIASRPFTGYGMGEASILQAMSNFGGLIPTIEGTKAMPAHNGFLDTGVQAGAFAALGFFVTGIVSFYRLLRSKLDTLDKKPIAAGIVFTFIATFFQVYSLGGVSTTPLTMSILWGLGNFAPVSSELRQATRRSTRRFS
jgi:hypothetical protein